MFNVSPGIPQKPLDRLYSCVERLDVGNVFLLFGAGRSKPDELAKIPEYLRRHYGFISLRYPDIAPRLTEKSQATAASPVVGSAVPSAADLMAALKAKYRAATASDVEIPINTRIACLDAVVRDLATLVTDTSAHLTELELYTAHVKLCITMLKAKAGPQNGSPEKLLHDSCLLMASAYGIEHTFRPLTGHYLAALRSVRAFAHAAWVSAMLRIKGGDDVTVDRMLQRLAERLRRLRKRLAKVGLADAAWDNAATFSAADRDGFNQWFASLTAMVQPPALPEVSTGLARPAGTITIPPPAGPSKALEVVAAYPASVEVSATLSGIDNIGDLFIEVLMPTGQMQRIHPPSSHFTKGSVPSDATLQTSLPLKFEKWTGAAPIGVRIAIEYDPDQIVPDVVMVRRALGDRSRDADRFCYQPLEAEKLGKDGFSRKVAYAEVKAITV